MRIRFILLFIIVPVIVWGRKQGQPLIDSLSSACQNIKIDTIKVKVLDRLSYAYSNVNPDSGIILGKQSLNLAKKINWQQGIATAYADIGINYEAKTVHDSAIKYESLAKDLYEKLGQKHGVASVLANMALIYHAKSDYANALNTDYEALKIFEETNDLQNQTIILENIGTLFFEQKQYDKTQAYYLQAISICKLSKDSITLARNISNMGILYNAQNRNLDALDNFFAALAISKRLGNKSSIQLDLANIGSTYCVLGEFQEALKYQLEALQISKSYGNKNDIAINLGNIGETYYTIADKAVDSGQSKTTAEVKTNLKKSISNLQQAVAMCKETSYMAPAAEFLSYLSKAYALSADYQKAYEAHIDYVAVRDSIFSLQKTTQVADLESKRLVAIKEKDLQLKDKQIQIAQLKIKQKQEEHILFLLGIILLLMVLALAFKSLLSYRKNNRVLTDEKEKNSQTILEQLHIINERNRILEEIAHTHSHDIRGHVSTILGLAHLLNKEHPADPANLTILEGIMTSAEKLDEVIKEVVQKENRLDKNDYN